MTRQFSKARLLEQYAQEQYAQEQYAKAPCNKLEEVTGNCPAELELDPIAPGNKLEEVTGNCPAELELDPIAPGNKPNHKKYKRYF